MHFVENISTTVYGRIEHQAASLRYVVNSAGSKVLDLKHAAYTAVEGRALAICDVATSTGEKAQKMIEENTMVIQLHKTSLAFVDTLDMLIDRYLPDPDATDSTNGAKAKTTEALIPRMLRIPVKIPARTIRIAIVRARDGYDLIQVQIKWSIQLTRDQKAKLKSLVLTKGQAIAERASSSSLAIALQQGKHDASQKIETLIQSLNAGKKVIGAKCHLVCERFYIIEVKDWTLKTVGSTVQIASNMLTGVSQRVYDVTALIGGRKRATGIFTLVGRRLPFVKQAIRERSASSGSLSGTSSEDNDQKLSSTGATLKAPKAAEQPLERDKEV
jgi:hypothetical protein